MKLSKIYWFYGKEADFWDRMLVTVTIERLFREFGLEKKPKKSIKINDLGVE